MEHWMDYFSYDMRRSSQTRAWKSLQGLPSRRAGPAQPQLQISSRGIFPLCQPQEKLDRNNVFYSSERFLRTSGYFEEIVNTRSLSTPLPSRPLRSGREANGQMKLNELNHLQTLRGPFSAVSTPIVASKYALESSRRDLHNALLCTVL